MQMTMANPLIVFKCFVLFIAALSSTNAETDGDAEVVAYEVGGALVLKCPLAAADGAVEWSRNGTAVADAAELRGRVQLRGAELALLGRALESDYGPYACAAGGARHAFDVRGRVRARLNADYSVVEEQALKVTCRLVGKPRSRAVWRFANASEEDVAELDAAQMLNRSDVRAAFGERVALNTSDAGVVDGVLVLSAARRSDAGRLACFAAEEAEAGEGALGDVATLRVKDKFAALWPFLGICAEVVVLCAVILVYERRRAKPDLDADDADADAKKS